MDEDALPSLELAPLLLDEGLEGLAEELEGLDEELSLGELLVLLPLLGEGASELVLPVLGVLAEPELMRSNAEAFERRHEGWQRA